MSLMQVVSDCLTGRTARWNDLTKELCRYRWNAGQTPQLIPDSQGMFRIHSGQVEPEHLAALVTDPLCTPATRRIIMRNYESQLREVLAQKQNSGNGGRS